MLYPDNLATMLTEEIMKALAIEVHYVFSKHSWVTLPHLGDFGDFMLPSDILVVANIIN